MKEKAAIEVTVGDMIDAMESLAPSYLAEEWDNCGLQVGSRLWPIQRVWIALDPLPSVIHTAVRRKIDLIITHHPLLFHPLRSIDLQTPIGRTIETALAGRLAVYSAHTNLDSTRQGVNDTLARVIGLHHVKALVPAEKSAAETDPCEPLGMGRLGWLAEPLTLKALAARIKTRLHLDAVKIAGDPDLIVDQVALCSGSGTSLMQAFLDSSAQVYVSGDLRYHDARTVEEIGRALIDVGHFPSEHLVLDPLAEQLRNFARDHKWSVIIEACGLEHDPFVAF